MRQNRRLRRLLTPKNALMSLNELSGTTISDYTIHQEDHGFMAEVIVNGVRYQGKGKLMIYFQIVEHSKVSHIFCSIKGTSKTGAKNSASEKALRDQIIQKMLTIPKKTNKPGQKKGDADGAASGASGNGNAGEGDGDVEMTEENDEAEIPMVHLASYALYKLFNEWQQDGFQIPDFKNIDRPQSVSAEIYPTYFFPIIQNNFSLRKIRKNQIELNCHPMLKICIQQCFCFWYNNAPSNIRSILFKHFFNFRCVQQPLIFHWEPRVSRQIFYIVWV